MRIKLVISLAVVALAAFSAGGATAASGRCNGGQALGGGTSVRNSGDPASGAGWIAFCNDGSTVPIGGSVELGGDANDQEGYVYVDGDDANKSMSSCADGFLRVEMGAGGPTFYSGGDGHAGDTNPSQPGNQPAQPRTPAEVVTDSASNCS